MELGRTKYDMTEYLLISGHDLQVCHYDDTSIVDQNGILQVRLTSRAGVTRICQFEYYFAFRKLDEGDAFSILRDVEASCGLGIGLYAVKNSEFLAWFSMESSGKYADRQILHYCMLTENSVIDVLSAAPPKWEFPGNST
jgi:hypothetical protein